MKICFVITKLMWGGAENQVRLLSLGLVERGHDVRVISLLKPEAYVNELNDAGVQVESLNLAEYAIKPLAAVALIRMLRGWKPDVVHCHLFHANLFGRAVRPFLPAHVHVSTAHSINTGGRKREIIYKLTDLLSDLSTNVSELATEKYVEVGAFRRGRSRTVLNGLDFQNFPGLANERPIKRQMLGIKPDEFVWLAAGRLEPAKDFPNLLGAFCSLVAQHASVRLMIAGEGSQRKALEDLIEVNGLSERVSLLGVRNDLKELMAIADAFVLSSAWEGLPMVLLEASASRLPIVSTDVGGIREIVSDQESGIVVESGSATLLAAGMKKLMKMPPGELKQMTEIAYSDAIRSFDLGSVTAEWESIYNGLAVKRQKKFFKIV